MVKRFDLIFDQKFRDRMKSSKASDWHSYGWRGYRGQNTVKFVQDEKYSTKSADFFRFLLYLCHVIDDFACLDLRH